MAVHKGQLASIATRRGTRRPELLAIGAAQPGALFELFSGAPARRTVMVRADSAMRVAHRLERQSDLALRVNNRLNRSADLWLVVHGRLGVDVDATVIATGEGTVAEVASTNRADLRGANPSYIPAPLVLLAQWGALPDALTLDLMRYDAANHPEPERFLAWADGGPCPYAGLSIARAANFHERRGLIKADFLSLPVKSSWQLACELSAVKGFQFAPAEVK